MEMLVHQNKLCISLSWNWCSNAGGLLSVVKAVTDRIGWVDRLKQEVNFNFTFLLDMDTIRGSFIVKLQWIFWTLICLPEIDVFVCLSVLFVCVVILRLL